MSFFKLILANNGDFLNIAMSLVTDILNDAKWSEPFMKNDITCLMEELKHPTEVAQSPFHLSITWYGIIDSCSTFADIVKLTSIFDRWKAFKWFATQVKGRQSVEQHDRLLCVQGECQNDHFFIVLKFYNNIGKSRVKHARLILEGLFTAGTEVGTSSRGSSILTRQKALGWPKLKRQ